MTPERARYLLDHHTTVEAPSGVTFRAQTLSVSDIRKYMTEQEILLVNDVWKTMDGNASFAGALEHIARVPPIEATPRRMLLEMAGARGVFVDKDAGLVGVWYGGAAVDILSLETGAHVDTTYHVDTYAIYYDEARELFQKHIEKGAE